MDQEQITIVDENGNEQLCQILFTFASDEFNKSYVVYAPIGQDEDEDGNVTVHAASFVEGEDGASGDLMAIETEEEWDLVEEMFNTFAEEQDEE